MKEIQIESYGKINLGLDVLYKRIDNYHEIATVMQSIDLKDKIYIKEIEEGIEISSNKTELPVDSTNLVYKAWKKIQEKTGIEKGVSIKIEKNIPIAAGLAGGSGNAAAVLKGLNDLWDLKLTDKELMEIGLEIGADVPFCILGGTALAEGIGERLTKLKSFAGKKIILINPGIEVSSKEVYESLIIDQNRRVDIESIVDYINMDDLNGLCKVMENVMEKVVIDKYPIINEIKNDILKCGALNSLMSGSGSTVFGFFDDEKLIENCRDILSKKYNNSLVIITNTI